MAKLKLNKELIEKMVALAKKGHYVQTICQACGISRQIYFRWENEAKALQLDIEDGKEIPEAKKIYLDFFNTMKSAHTEYLDGLLKLIKAHSVTTWQAAAWLIERRWDIYSLRQKIETTYKGELTLIQQAQGLSEKELTEEISRFESIAESKERSKNKDAGISKGNGKKKSKE